jgi:peptidoglycan pentaglycine glycine transferase (the first glycine)
VTHSLTPTDWETCLSTHPEAHLLQTSLWGELKSNYGWGVERLSLDSSGAQILFRRLPLGLTLAYIPKGPLGHWLPNLLPRLDGLCRERRAFALKIEPDSAWEPTLEEQLRSHGFIPSPHSIQPRRTLIVDLHGEEEDILARMHQKTRYNVRLAARKGVFVRPWNDPQGFARMMQETAARDRFGAHVPAYYEKAHRLFHQAGACEILAAVYDDQPLAALMVFAWGKRAWYFYGASSSHHRNYMPTYLLQWEAMRWARKRGCTAYDLWGVPDEPQESLEAQFVNRQDGLWGVYRFKRGFGGELVRSIGAWDRPYKRSFYAIYQTLATRWRG